MALRPLFGGRIRIWSVGFCEGDEHRRTRRKTLGARTRINNKLNAHVTPGPGIEPRPQQWEARALSTPPSLFPNEKEGINWRVGVLFESKPSSSQHVCSVVNNMHFTEHISFSHLLNIMNISLSLFLRTNYSQPSL